MWLNYSAVLCKIGLEERDFSEISRGVDSDNCNIKLYTFVDLHEYRLSDSCKKRAS